MQFRLNPGLLKELISASLDPLVIVDEIQKIPALLDDVHWCLENTTSKFILCGSSALKLKRSAANLLGGRAWRIETEKFYLFDCGLARGLQHIPYIESKTSEFGRAFEHIIINEVRAYLNYKDKHLPIYFWRTSTGQEVDLIVGQLDLCLEIKASSFVREQDLKGLKALCSDQDVKQAIVVSQDEEMRKIGDILIMPWQVFCDELWSGKLC